MQQKPENFNHIRVKPDVHRKVKIAAALSDMGVNEWIDMMASRALSEATDFPALAHIVSTSLNIETKDIVS